MNFNLLESIMTSTHYWFRENTGFPLKRKSFYFFFCFVNLRQYLTNEIFLWHKSRSKHIYTFSFWNKKNQFDFFRSESRPRFDQLVGLPLIFWTKNPFVCQRRKWYGLRTIWKSGRDPSSLYTGKIRKPVGDANGTLSVPSYAIRPFCLTGSLCLIGTSP